MLADQKHCNRCATTKPLDQFHNDRRSKDGRQRRCKPCQHLSSREWDAKFPGQRAAAQAAWHVRHLERQKQKTAAYRAANPNRARDLIERHRREDPKSVWAGFAASSAKQRSKLKGVPFGITREYIRSIAPDVCPALGIELAYPQAGQRQSLNDNSATVDRIIPALGYVVGNVAIISNRANRIKTNADAQELEAVAQWLRTQE